jgi:hypothetical protein
MARLPITLVSTWSKSRAMTSVSVVAVTCELAAESASSSFATSVRFWPMSSTDSTRPEISSTAYNSIFALAQVPSLRWNRAGSS